MVDGEYQFDIELAGERHAQNLENFKVSLEKRIPCVIVDNTNVKVSQYAPYVEAAHDLAYTVVFVELHHPALMVAVDRNTHGVPKEVINQMMLEWEPAQHNAVVEDLLEAGKVVKLLQAREKIILWFAFGVGSIVGSAVIAFAWALSKGFFLWR
jgi:predicted kinase